MLTLRQFYLTKLAEECNEVAQRALKQVQFGRDEIQPGQDQTNGERLLDEIIDLATISRILVVIREIEQLSAHDADKKSLLKLEKLEKYLAYSQSLGEVES